MIKIKWRINTRDNENKLFHDPQFIFDGDSAEVVFAVDPYNPILVTKYTDFEKYSKLNIIEKNQLRMDGTVTDIVYYD